MITLKKVLINDSAQNAPDVRHEILEDRGVLSVRRSDLSACNAQAGEEIEATQQTGYFQRNQT